MDRDILHHTCALFTTLPIHHFDHNCARCVHVMEGGDFNPQWVRPYMKDGELISHFKNFRTWRLQAGKLIKVPANLFYT